MAARIRVLLLASLQLLAQPGGGLIERIRNAPLPGEQRQALETAFSKKDFAAIEPILNATPAAEPQALLGALEFVAGRMSQAIQAFRRSDALKALDDHDRFTLAMALVNVGDVKGSRVE